MIDQLRCLDARGHEWEWVCGRYDYHVQFEDQTKAWVLEKFLTQERNAERAHEDEQECESLEDALLFSIEAHKPMTR